MDLFQEQKQSRKTQWPCYDSSAYQTTRKYGAFRLAQAAVLILTSPPSLCLFVMCSHTYISHTETLTYPLGISPTTSMLYLLVSPQKWVMIVAAMICWTKIKRNVQYAGKSLLWEHTTNLFCKSTVPQSSRITVVKMPPAGRLNEHTRWMSEKGKESKGRTHNYEFYRDGHRQLLSVAGVEFFDYNENTERHQADHQLRHLSLRQLSADIHQSLWGKRWRKLDIILRLLDSFLMIARLGYPG